MKMKQLSVILLFFFVSIVCSCTQSNNKHDFIDYSIDELSKYFEPTNVFMIIECVDYKGVIRIHMESRKRKISFIGDFYTYCFSKDKCVDIIVNDNCIDIIKLTNKKLETYTGIKDSDTIYRHTGDDNLTEYKFITILYDTQNNKILNIETYNKE